MPALKHLVTINQVKQSLYSSAPDVIWQWWSRTKIRLAAKKNPQLLRVAIY
jgi:hypothetical protein